VLRMCLRGEDYESERQRSLLLSLPDKDIRKIWREEKSLFSEVVLHHLDELFWQREECELHGLSLGELKKRVGIAAPFS
jgi:hypothetical protein